MIQNQSVKAGKLQFGPVWPSLDLHSEPGFEGGGGRGNLSLWSRGAQKNRNGSDNQRFKDRDSGSGALTSTDQTQ